MSLKSKLLPKGTGFNCCSFVSGPAIPGRGPLAARSARPGAVPQGAAVHWGPEARQYTHAAWPVRSSRVHLLRYGLAPLLSACRAIAKLIV